MPREKRGIQYAAALPFCPAIALEYWVARSSRAMTTYPAASFSARWNAGRAMHRAI